MNKELKVLELADYCEKFVVEDALGYLIVNKNIEKYQCMFGFIKLPNNIETVKKLFNLIEKKAQELGFRNIIGPINYTTWMSYRWALNNYDLKLYPDCDNPKYYVDFIKELGYKELYTYRSAFINVNNKLYDIGQIIYNQKIDEGYEFKFFYGKDVYEQAWDVYNISINAFQGSYLYSEIPYDYFKQIYLEWTKKVDVVLYIAYKDDKAIGYVMGYLNPYSNDFISKTSAVLKEYQNNKVYVALLYLGVKYIKELGFDKMVYHFQCEQKKTFQRFDKDIESNEKRYAIFIKEFN